MADTHAVVRTDLMQGSDTRNMLVSVRYMGDDGETPTDIDNGNIVKIGDLMEDEREIHIATTPASSDAVADIALVAGVELMYDERKRNLDEYYNEAEVTFRCYYLHSHDIFSVTAEALDGDAEIGSVIAIGDSTLLAVGGAGTQIGTVIRIETAGRYTYYMIQVD